MSDKREVDELHEPKDGETQEAGEPQSTETDASNASASAEESEDAKTNAGQCASFADESDSTLEAESEDEALASEASEIERLKSELEALSGRCLELETQLADTKRDVDYARAETQTAVRRGREDVARSVNRTKRDLVMRLTDVADTFSRSAEEISKIEQAELSPSVQSTVQAIEMAISSFNKVLGAEGLQEINPQGETFDPQYHEAQASVPMADKEPGTIIDVLRVGYQLDDTLLRAAQVVVAKQLDTSENEPDAEKSDDS